MLLWNLRKVLFLIRKFIIYFLLNLIVSIRGFGLFLIKLFLGNWELIYLFKFSNYWRCLEWFFIVVKERRDWIWMFFVIFFKSLLISLNCGEFFYFKVVKIDLFLKFDVFGVILILKLWYCKVCLDCIL